ncbi:MAG TPA: VTT domain-containing protein [Pyrinomonadaceae bacterium]|nr:VTT domain-containing protein [Pyrinomonadaceae bacterium]
MEFSEYPAAALFALVLFGTFVSEDAACVFAGTLAANGRMSLAAAITAAFLGIVVGDVALYFLGRGFGAAILRTRLAARLVSNEALSRSSAWLNKRGASAVFVSRFVTGLRLPTYVAAGALRTHFGRFLFYFVIAALVWTPLLVGAAYSGTALSGSALIAAVVVLIAVRFTLRLSNWKSRRLLIGRLKRIANWEFWPLQVFYAPVVLYVIYLGIRFRSLTVFTCANPAIETGGLVGESKNSIYDGLGDSSHSLKHTLSSSDDHYSDAVEFMHLNELDLPIVVKPDRGERGRGVKIIRTQDELRGALVGEDLIIQEFAEGLEASVFYYRFPHEERGRIFSITEKCFPGVVGDGVSNVETLILRDVRAVCMANSYFAQNSSKLDYVPARDEKFSIINIGTHSRGAIFLDGSHLWTHTLEARIDEISRSFDGFHFGRFDLRASSFDALRRGCFKIIELNGVSSESTNIYDPGYTLRDAYRTLFAQWRIAFEIGEANRRLGARPTPLMQLAGAIVGYN